MIELPEDIRQMLIKMGLAEKGQALSGEALTGGVASDIWRIDIQGKSVCAKRALEQLKVSREWRVPVNRNAFEVAWLEVAASIVPGAVPRILGHDPSAGIFVMEYLPPQHYSVWKSQLRSGLVEQRTIMALADTLCKIHRETAADDSIAKQFDNDELFYSLRLEPYFHATADIHRDLIDELSALSAMFVSNKRVLVHGDISPKNILVGSQGPIIIDAECACYGDPAFDLAFCLNHLLLKCLWAPTALADLVIGFDLLAKQYLSAVNWESAAELESRAAKMLPGLMLARIDGKSPVEYITDDSDRNKVRDFSRKYLLEPVEELTRLSHNWHIALS